MDGLMIVGGGGGKIYSIILSFEIAKIQIYKKNNQKKKESQIYESEINNKVKNEYANQWRSSLRRRLAGPDWAFDSQLEGDSPSIQRSMRRSRSKSPSL